MNQLKLCTQMDNVSSKSTLEPVFSNTSTAPAAASTMAPPGGEHMAPTPTQQLPNEKAASEVADSSDAEAAATGDIVLNAAESNDEAEPEVENELTEPAAARDQTQQQNAGGGGSGRRNKKQRAKGRNKLSKKQERKRRKEEHERAKAGNRLSNADGAAGSDHALSEPPDSASASVSASGSGGGSSKEVEVSGSATLAPTSKEKMKDEATAGDSSGGKPPGVVYCNAVLKTLVHIPPPILILHLKRFEQVLDLLSTIWSIYSKLNAIWRRDKTIDPS